MMSDSKIIFPLLSLPLELIYLFYDHIFICSSYKNLACTCKILASIARDKHVKARFIKRTTKKKTEGLADFYVVLNGTKHGEEKRYFSRLRNNIMSIRYYVFGVVEGEVLEFYSNGNIKIHFTVKKGVKHGQWTHYNYDGTVKTVLNYYNGLQN